MAKKVYNDARDLAGLSARFYASDLETLQDLSDATEIEKGIYPRLALRLLVRMYERDGQVSLPAVIVSLGDLRKGPIKLPEDVLGKSAVADAEGSEVSAIQPHTFRYYVSDLEVLRQISRQSGLKPGTYIRVAFHLLMELYRRDGRIALPIVMVTVKEARRGPSR